MRIPVGSCEVAERPRRGSALSGVERAYGLVVPTGGSTGASLPLHSPLFGGCTIENLRSYYTDMPERGGYTSVPRVSSITG